MFVDILQHTPVWVWGLLAALVMLGLSQTRPRDVSLARLTLLPLAMVALSLGGVLGAFGHMPVALGAWSAGMGTALLLARAVPVRGAYWAHDTGLLHLPGSWLPLTLIVGLFMVKYVAGASLAMHPSLATDARFAGLCSLAYGAFSGIFLARAFGLRARATRSAALQRA